MFDEVPFSSKRSGRKGAFIGLYCVFHFALEYPLLLLQLPPLREGNITALSTHFVLEFIIVENTFANFHIFPTNAEAASDVVDGSYGGQDARLIYGVFTTPANSIAGNALCAFRLRDVLDVFEGAFKEQETANSNWLPVPKIKEPADPRPGRCVDDSKALPEATLSFVRGHSIMDEAVPSYFGGRPLFVKANLQ